MVAKNRRRLVDTRCVQRRVPLVCYSCRIGGSRSRSRHDAKLSRKPLSSKCSGHGGSLRARRGSRSPRGNDAPHDAELIADLLFLEGPGRTGQGCVPIWP